MQSSTPSSTGVGWNVSYISSTGELGGGTAQDSDASDNVPSEGASTFGWLAYGVGPIDLKRMEHKLDKATPEGAASPPKKSYWRCVGRTTVEDALWGAAGTAALAVVAPTVGFGIAGSSIGPEGTLAGAGLGFAVGVAIAPAAAADSLVLGVPVGLFHGLVGCAFQ